MDYLNENPSLDESADQANAIKCQAPVHQGYGGYDPNKLIDALIRRMLLKNDVALCRALEVGPPLISKIRNRTLPVSAALLIRMHEESNISIAELRSLMGDRRSTFRTGLRGRKARKKD